MENKGLWKIFKESLCEDNGNGSGMRFGFYIVLVSVLAMAFMYLHNQLEVKGTIEWFGLNSLLVTLLSLIITGKIIQKTKEANVDGGQKAEPTDVKQEIKDVATQLQNQITEAAK